MKSQLIPPQSKKGKYRQQLGRLGEELAVRYLESHDYRLVTRNFKARYGEIDLIALDKNILVFLEVKTRIGRKFGRPEEAITPRKLREVILTARYYKMLHPELPEAMRIDVIGIELDFDHTLKSFNHILNVTL